MKNSPRPSQFDALPTLQESGVFNIIGKANGGDVRFAADALANQLQSDEISRRVARANSALAIAFLNAARDPETEFGSAEEAILYGMRLALATLDRAELRAAVEASNLAT